MLKPLALILVCQLAGEALARVSGWLIPGPVIGFIGLFALLALGSRNCRGLPSDGNKALNPLPGGGLGNFADQLLSILGLMFVPTGVGIVAHAALFEAHWPELIAILVLSVLGTLFATVAIFVVVARLVSLPRSDS